MNYPRNGLAAHEDGKLAAVDDVKEVAVIALTNHVFTRAHLALCQSPNNGLCDGARARERAGAGARSSIVSNYRPFRHFS